MYISIYILYYIVRSYKIRPIYDPKLKDEKKDNKNAFITCVHKRGNNVLLESLPMFRVDIFIMESRKSIIFFFHVKYKNVFFI